jgi:hypothetical protein
VQGLAQMLGPMRPVGEAIVQAFRFIAMADDDHHTLRRIADQYGWTLIRNAHSFLST